METIRRAKIRQPIMMTQVLRPPPVPVKVKRALEISSLKSTPFIATLRVTCSSEMSAGSSEIDGVRHNMVVELMKVADEVPNLPNLHFGPY
jgi:hypothetical protein